MPTSKSTDDVHGATETVRVHVTTADEAAEVFLMDADFKLVARGRGDMDLSVEPGLYKVKIRAGAESYEEHLIVETGKGTVERNYGPMRFVSPAPLSDTLRTHDYHISNAQIESRKTHVDAGKGSFIFLFCRDWTSSKPAEGPSEPTHPAQGLFLCDTDGNVLVDFARQAVVNLRLDPWAACNVSVTPGVYRLRLVRPAHSYEQTVVASKDWQTQVFALQRRCGKGGREKCADLQRAAIFLARPQSGFSAASQEHRLSELARLGLSNQRMVLSDRQCQELLAGKFQNPMLGIYGAHLLMMNKAASSEVSLGKAITNLRRLLVTPHPDVESLALSSEDQTGDYIFTAPPMLSRSWTLILESTVRRPELVPLGSLADRATDHLVTAEPWLISWIDCEPNIVPDRSAGEENGLLGATELVRNYLQERTLPRRIKAYADVQSVPWRAAAPSEDQGYSASPSWWGNIISSKDVEYLVKTLRVPRAKLESILNELTAPKENQITSEFQGATSIAPGQTPLS